PVVVRGIVDEHVDWPELAADVRKQLADRCDIGQVALVVARWRGAVCETSFQLTRIRLRDVEERDAGALLRKSFDDGRADARAAAGNDDSLVAQRGIDGVRGHRSSCEPGSNPRCARL